MNKKISAAVILRQPVTRTILAGHRTGQRFFKWKYNQKTSQRHSLDLPKGEMSSGEAPVETAVRELFEETGIAVDPAELQYLGFYPYIKTKDLHIFYIERAVDLHELRCDSCFESKVDGKMYPELNGFALLTMEELDMLFEPMERVVKQALREHDLYE
jgi:8-oxo-dGTP pyrophosphatase MutT (NUDIX family)